MILYHNRNGSTYKIETGSADGGFYFSELSRAKSNNDVLGFEFEGSFRSKMLGATLEQAVRRIDALEEMFQRTAYAPLRASDV